MRALFLIGCLVFSSIGPAMAEVKIENCDKLSGTADRLKCLQSNDVAMKAVIDALQQSNDRLAKGLEELRRTVVNLPKPPPPPSLDNVVKYGDGLTIYRAHDNPGRGFRCMMGDSMADCNLDSPNLQMRFRLSPTKILQ